MSTTSFQSCGHQMTIFRVADVNNLFSELQTSTTSFQSCGHQITIFRAADDKVHDADYKSAFVYKLQVVNVTINKVADVK